MISGLELRCVVGVEDWERLMPQRVLVEITLHGDFSAAAASDDLVDTLDYGAICIRAAKIAGEGEYRLLETLADRIARSIVDAHDCIASATIAVHKPLALAGFDDARATVEVKRDRGPR